MFIQNRSTFYHDNTVEYDETDWTNEINRLRDRVELLEKVVSNFPGGLSLFDENLQMVLCNYRQFEMLEYTDDLLQNGLPTMEELFRYNAERGEYGPGDVEMHVRRRMALAKKQLQHCYERERPNGDVLEIRGAPLEGGGFVTTYTDVTERRRDQDLIEHLTRHDALTCLTNRLLFNDRLELATAQVRRGATIAVHMVNLDNFRQVNEEFGRRTGDEVLKLFAQRLRATVRDTDTVARLDGDEFGVIQTGVPEPENAMRLADRILDVLDRPLEVDGNQIRLTCSCGIVLAPEQGTDPDELMTKVDLAVYKSRSCGGRQFNFYTEDIVRKPAVNG